MTYKNETLNEREKTHGDFKDTARMAQVLKDTIRSEHNRLCDATGGAGMNYIQHEAIDQICTKIARIVSGNCNEIDHWRDIAGYASLVSENLTRGRAEA